MYHDSSKMKLTGKDSKLLYVNMKQPQQKYISTQRPEMGNCLTKKHEVSFFYYIIFGLIPLVCTNSILFDEESAHYAISKTHTETQISVLWTGFKFTVTLYLNLYSMGVVDLKPL